MKTDSTSATKRHPRMIYQTPETREGILSIAERLFTEKGLFETQMTDIATAAGVSRTTLYRYYRDKLDLSLAIIERVMDDVDRIVAAEARPKKGTGIERLSSHLRHRWFSPALLPHLRFFAEFDAYFSGPRLPVDFKIRLDRAMHEPRIDELLCIISDGVADGSIRSDIDVELAAVTVINSIRSLQQLLFMRGKVLLEVPRRYLSRMNEEHLRYLLDGLRAR